MMWAIADWFCFIVGIGVVLVLITKILRKE